MRFRMKTSRIRILRGRGTPPPCVSAAAPLFRFCLLLEQLVGPVKQPIQVWNPFEALDSDLAHQTCRSMLPSAQLGWTHSMLGRLNNHKPI